MTASKRVAGVTKVTPCCFRQPVRYTGKARCCSLGVVVIGVRLGSCRDWRCCWVLIDMSRGGGLEKFCSLEQVIVMGPGMVNWTGSTG